MAFVRYKPSHLHWHSFDESSIIRYSKTNNPFEDFLSQIFESKTRKQSDSKNKESVTFNPRKKSESFDDNGEDDDPLGEDYFRKELVRRQQKRVKEPLSVSQFQSEGENNEEDFSGYDLRDVIKAKWGVCFDVDFRAVQTMGTRSVYLNVLPFTPKSRKFRHKSEMDYLCHLQAVVEILIKYDRLDFVLAQLYETKKVPRANTSPLKAVPFRLDLPPEALDRVLRGE
eukprot:CAMPEP_0113316432 /NCGR_PEP_ID=MMETSP0010_2-20120614/11710_1 /TAXON_ID=216773 ORGANISM="Corethron hystrix, Strain 308" /NCGR_SAMPLE_ID=MMETSP0010_2 /ASSEMBLY_ACC=CAM_ASM_000155 /LENGTH=226 /DNA_ID=CAMNT_0000173147 /DNA_START=91 /DNA_END=771 /DNA_ORIENTATION=- /assembly_acc=CAM_ASM_000155